MFVSFTQTYGNDRVKLHEIYSRDEKLIEFKNLFDVNFHSFHNCSQETIDNYIKLNTVKNSRYLYFKNIPYSYCIYSLKHHLKKLGCTHFFFCQDDTFSANNTTVDSQELFNYIKRFDKDFMFSLQASKDIIDCRLTPNEKMKTFDIFHLSSEDLVKVGMWGMDDSPFICTSDLIDIVYDEIYVAKGNIDFCENYLRDKFSVVKINRFISEYPLFKNYNFIGKTISKRNQHIAELKRKKLYT